MVLLLCRRMDDELLGQFGRLSDAVSDSDGCRLLLDGSSGSALSRFSNECYTFDPAGLERLGYPLFRSPKIVPGSAHYPVLLFFKDFPDFDHYWLVENDVRFSGDWRTLFDYYEDDDADFISAHLRDYSDEPDWCWWNLEHPEEAIDPRQRLRSFNPLCRFSRRALAYVDRMHREGWVGHSEVLLPTLLKMGGYRIVDFGGKGRYVRQEDRERFYTEEESSSPDGGLKGTLRYRPCFERAGSLSGKIYHPVKSQTATELKAQIESLNQVVAERDKALARLEGELKAIHESKLWRFGCISAGLFRKLLPWHSWRYEVVRLLLRPVMKKAYHLGRRAGH